MALEAAVQKKEERNLWLENWVISVDQHFKGTKTKFHRKYNISSVNSWFASAVIQWNRYWNFKKDQKLKSNIEDKGNKRFVRIVEQFTDSFRKPVKEERGVC